MKRRAPSAEDAHDILLADAEPAERSELAWALKRLHESLIPAPPGPVKVI